MSESTVITQRRNMIMISRTTRTTVTSLGDLELGGFAGLDSGLDS